MKTRRANPGYPVGTRSAYVVTVHDNRKAAREGWATNAYYADNKGRAAVIAAYLRPRHPGAVIKVSRGADYAKAHPSQVKNPPTAGDNVAAPYSWAKKEAEYQAMDDRTLLAARDQALANRTAAEGATPLASLPPEIVEKMIAVGLMRRCAKGNPKKRNPGDAKRPLYPVGTVVWDNFHKRPATVIKAERVGDGAWGYNAYTLTFHDGLYGDRTYAQDGAHVEALGGRKRAPLNNPAKKTTKKVARRTFQAQEYLLERAHFSEARAKAWLKKNGHKYGTITASEQYFHAPQHAASDYQKGTLHNIGVAKHVEAVVGIPKTASDAAASKGYGARGPRQGRLPIGQAYGGDTSDVMY